jgi:hypothetical protein
MLRRECLHMLPALMVAVENDRSPVTYLVLSMRLCGLGGDRHCRGILEQMCRLGWTSVTRQSESGDGREKVVCVTDEGMAALRQHHTVLGMLVGVARDGLTGPRGRLDGDENLGPIARNGA